MTIHSVPLFIATLPVVAYSHFALFMVLSIITTLYVVWHVSQNAGLYHLPHATNSGYEENFGFQTPAFLSNAMPLQIAPSPQNNDKRPKFYKTTKEQHFTK